MGQNDIILADLSAEVLSDIGNATHLNGVFISEDVPAEDGIKAWFLKLIYYWNLVIWSSDLAQLSWGKGRVDISGTSGLIATAVSGTHLISTPALDIRDKTVTFSMKARKGVVDFIRTSMGGGTFAETNFDLGTGTVLNTAADVTRITDDGEGWYFCASQAKSSVGSNTGFIALTLDGIVDSFMGDGVSVYADIKEVQVNEGTIAANFPHIDTTTVAVSAPAYVHEEIGSGKKVNVLTGVLETPALSIAGGTITEYYDGFVGSEQAYYIRFDETVTVDTEIQPLWATCPITRFTGIKGDIYNGSTQHLSLGSYLASTAFSALEIQGVDLNLRLGSSFHDIGDAYLIELRYLK
jgi:hypothetical protein